MPIRKKIDLWRLWGMFSAVLMIVGIPLVGVVFRYVIMLRIEKIEESHRYTQEKTEQSQRVFWQQLNKMEEKIDKLTSMIVMIDERINSRIPMHVTSEVDGLKKEIEEKKAQVPK